MGESSREDASNTLRVLVATDCHLGYMEKDEIRRLDSFHAFEEICSVAEQKEVDLILLGGDLFHENKPSRSTLVRTAEILRKYCLNDRPVQFQVVSDQTMNFLNSFGHVNYEDPNFNVGLPVFTIHGNHDDPAGVDNLSAIDLLSACNLVNYFGKTVLGGSGVGQITLHPILIKKGTTLVALYGLGNIRDERLNRMFQTPHAVQWIRPEPQEDCQVSDWFNILAIHQNRVKANPKNAVSEHFLPRFLDFILWGHEHECLADPMEVPGMGFHVCQPGSSVATSLIEGEAKAKHIVLLEIKGTQYRSTKIPLKSVRPFEYAEVVLKDVDEVDPNDQTSVLEYLDKTVVEMIERSRKKPVNRSELKLPLVRIKVDYTGVMTINPQRFGQKYVGKVANPQDILLFSKTAKKRQSADDKTQVERLRPDELNQQNIEALVAESNLKMEILPINDLTTALHEFVSKDDKMAFYSCVQYNLNETRNKLSKEADVLKIEDDELLLRVERCMQERTNERLARRPAQGNSFLDVSEDKDKGTVNPESSVDFGDDDLFLQSASKGKKGAPVSKTFRSTTESSQSRASKRGRGRGTRGLKQTTLDASLRVSRSERSVSLSSHGAAESLSSDELEINEINEASDDSEPEENPAPKGRKRAAPRGRGRGMASSKRAKNSDSSLLQSMMMHTDEDDDDDIPKVQPRVTRNYGAVRKR